MVSSNFQERLAEKQTEKESQVKQLNKSRQSIISYIGEYMKSVVDRQIYAVIVHREAAHSKTLDDRAVKELKEKTIEASNSVGTMTKSIFSNDSFWIGESDIGEKESARDNTLPKEQKEKIDSGVIAILKEPAKLLESYGYKQANLVFLNEYKIRENENEINSLIKSYIDELLNLRKISNSIESIKRDIDSADFAETWKNTSIAN